MRIEHVKQGEEPSPSADLIQGKLAHPHTTGFYYSSRLANKLRPSIDPQL